MDLDHHGQATQRLLPKGMALRQGPSKMITSSGFHIVWWVPRIHDGDNCTHNQILHNHSTVYHIVQQRIRAIKLSSVIILMVGACWGQIDEVPSHISIFETWFAATGVCISQPQQHSKPGMMNNWRHNWTKLFTTLTLPYITPFDKTFVLVPSWLSPWLMAMSAESGAGDPTRISAEVQAWVFTARCCGGGQHLRRYPWGDQANAARCVNAMQGDV